MKPPFLRPLLESASLIELAGKSRVNLLIVSELFWWSQPSQHHPPSCSALRTRSWQAHDLIAGYAYIAAEYDIARTLAGRLGREIPQLPVAECVCALVQGVSPGRRHWQPPSF